MLFSSTLYKILLDDKYNPNILLLRGTYHMYLKMVAAAHSFLDFFQSVISDVFAVPFEIGVVESWLA